MERRPLDSKTAIVVYENNKLMNIYIQKFTPSMEIELKDIEPVPLI